MKELLSLCGYEGKELEQELPRIERAFGKIGITAADIETAKQRLNKYYDLELKGLRKIIRLLVKDVVSTVLAKEEYKTFVCGFMSPGFVTYGGAIMSNSKDVFATHLGQQFQVVLGAIFDKIIPVFEAAEAKWTKAGAVAHCGNVKTMVGLVASGMIPKPDFLTTTGYLCDTAPKTIDLLKELYDIPTCCYTACQDRDVAEYDAATKRVSVYGGKTLERCAEGLEQAIGFKITDDMLKEAMDVRGQFLPYMGKLQGLIGGSDPLVMGSNHQVLWFCLGSAVISKETLPEFVDAVDTLYKELEERVAKGVGILEKGAPRILAILPSHYTDPRLDAMVNEMGINITGTDLFLLPPGEEPPETLCEQFTAESIGVSYPQSTIKRIPLIIEECKRSNVVGVLNRYHVGCRSVTGDAMMVREAITRELGIPVMMMERDDFDPRAINYEQYKRNLEVFKTMIEQR